MNGAKVRKIILLLEGVDFLSLLKWIAVVKMVYLIL